MDEGGDFHERWKAWQQKGQSQEKADPMTHVRAYCWRNPERMPPRRAWNCLSVDHAERAYVPCFQLALRQRSRPSGVRGPVDIPP